MFNGEVFRGRYMGVDFTDDDRAKHELEFDLEDGTTRTIVYGDLEAAIVLNPRLRRKKGLPT